jgi:3-hydroxyacyl-[acyl-carrier-protein] dehydratase
MRQLGKERRHTAQLHTCASGSPAGPREEEFNMMMDIHQILKRLPHRYPFLLVDRVLELEKGNVRILALKNVTINEPFFTGHFPHRPVMPGVLMLEAMAQAAALLAFDTDGRRRRTTRRSYYFAGIDGARFKRPVEPGDQLIMDVSARPRKRRHPQVQGPCHGRWRTRRAKPS